MILIKRGSLDPFASHPRHVVFSRKIDCICCGLLLGFADAPPQIEERGAMDWHGGITTWSFRFGELITTSEPVGNAVDLLPRIESVG